MTGFRCGVIGIGMGAKSFGGGRGAGDMDAGGGGAGMEVSDASDSVDGGRGGSWNEEEDALRALVREAAPKDERRSEAIAGKLS